MNNLKPQTISIHTHTHTHTYIYMSWVQLTTDVTLSNIIPLNNLL